MSAPEHNLGNDFDVAIQRALALTLEDVLGANAVLFWHCDYAHAYFARRAWVVQCQLPDGAHADATVVSKDDGLPEARARYLARHYRGAPDLPKWVVDGVQVRVKGTPDLKRAGLRTSTDDRAWPKEVGTIRRREGNGWWTWVLEFERGRTASGNLDAELLAQLARVKS